MCHIINIQQNTVRSNKWENSAKLVQFRNVPELFPNPKVHSSFVRNNYADEYKKFAAANEL